jgi:hypothetical protein
MKLTAFGYIKIFYAVAAKPVATSYAEIRRNL